MAQTGTRSGRGRTARRVQHDRRPTPSGGAVRRGGSALSTLRETVVVLVVALVLASLLRAFVVQAFVVPSQSMENTLMGGDGVNDRIVVDKLPDQTVRRGEIVVFTDPGGWLDAEPGGQSPSGHVQRVLEFVGVLPNNSTGHLVKRVVGVGGDTVSCAGGAAPLKVDGVALSESAYLYPGSLPCGPNKFSYTVPAGHLFVIGDNRGNSADSRYPHPSGPFVPESDVTGRVIAVVYPFDRISRERIPADFASLPSAK